MREINKNPDSSYENETEFNKGAPKSIFNLFSNRFCNKFQRVIAGAMASIFLLSTPTFAKDNTTGGTTNQNKTNYTNSFSVDLSGGKQFTNLEGVPQNSLTDDGIYAFEDPDTNSYYLMFTNKKTAKADSFYRTVGFTVTPPSLTKQTSGTENFGSIDSPRIIMDEAYEGTAYNNAGGKHLDKNLSEKGGGNAADYDNVITRGAPSGSVLNNYPDHAVTHPGDKTTTTTCFKIDLTSLRTYASKALGTSYDPTETYYVTLNAIQLVQFGGDDKGGPHYTYDETYDKFEEVGFSDRSKASLITYYNIPITLGPSAYNAVTLIDVGGTDYEVIGTARDVMLADVNFSMNQTLKNSANFDYSNCNVVGAAVVPYGAFGKEAADKSAEGNCFFIDEALPSHAYYPNYQDMLIKNTANYVTAKYPGNELRKQRGSEDGWFRSYGTTDVSDFVNSQLITGLNKQIDGSWDITNDRHFTGTQVYLFVAPPGPPSNDNLVIYNNETGEPLATGTVDYKIWYDNLKKIYNGQLNNTTNVNDLDSYYQIAGDTTSIFEGGKINNYNLEADSEAKVINMSVKDRPIKDASTNSIYKVVEGERAAYTNNARGLDALNLTFPSSLKTKSGQKLVFKGVEAVFNTTINEDIAATKPKAGNTINLKSISDAKSKLASSSIATFDADTSTYQVDITEANDIDDMEFGKIFKDNFGKFISDNKNFIIPTLATCMTIRREENEPQESYCGFTFANRYTLANIPWDIRLKHHSGVNSNFSTPIRFMMKDGLLYTVFFDTAVKVDWQGGIPLKEGFDRYARYNENRNYDPWGVTFYDFKANSYTYGASAGSNPADYKPTDTDCDEIIAGNYAEPTSDYIIRAIYEPANIPVLYYYKDEVAGRIKIMKSEYTSRVDSTVVKGSITVDGKKYYTDETSYRENTDLEKDITSTTSDTEIMKDPVDKHRSKSVSVDTKDIASTDKDYVVRVKLVDTPTVLINESADYEMGTFKIRSQYLADNFSYNSAPTSGGLVNLTRQNGESLGQNSDNFINKQGVFTDSTNTTRDLSNPDTYDNAAVESRYVQAVFDHNLFAQIFRAHRGPSPSDYPDLNSPYDANEDGDPFTGAITLYREEDTSDGNTINVEVPCLETVDLKFKDIAAKWINDSDVVFENAPDGLILRSSINEMGGKYSGSANSYKAENGLTQYVLGNISNENPLQDKDTKNDTAKLPSGIVKTNFGMNFTSSRKAFNFIPVLASYAEDVETSKNLLRTIGFDPQDNPNDSDYDIPVSNGVNTGYTGYEQTNEAQERIVANLVVDDDLDMVQNYDKTETHNASKPDDPCDKEDESDEINPSEITRGTFGGYVVASETAKVTDELTVSAPEPPSDTEETWIDPEEPLKVYPSYNMKITTDSGDKNIPVLSPTPITINTNLKFKIEGAEKQPVLKLKAVFTRGGSGSIASGSAYQYIANTDTTTSSTLSKTLTIDYLEANEKYIPNANAYNTKIQGQLNSVLAKLRKTDEHNNNNYKVVTVSNIPYALGSVGRYKISFTNAEPTVDETTSSNKLTETSDLISVKGFNDALARRNDSQKRFGWYTETFPLGEAVIVKRVTIKVTYEPGSSNTAVLHINCASDSGTDGTSAPIPDTEFAKYYPTLGDINTVMIDGTPKLIVTRDNKPNYLFETSVLVRPKADNITFFNKPINMVMYSDPDKVKFKVIKSAYDYRD